MSPYERSGAARQKITSFLWFDDKAEEAANFYVSVFNNNPGHRLESKITSITRYDKAGAEASGRPKGTVMTLSFELEGQEFVALNGGPPPTGMTFSSLVSFVVNCKNQEEVDWFWEKLSQGGEKGVCGWINKDKYGVTWQVVPTIMVQLLQDKDPEKAERVMQAMLKMKKIDIEELKKAYNRQ